MSNLCLSSAKLCLAPCTGNESYQLGCYALIFLLSLFCSVCHCFDSDAPKHMQKKHNPNTKQKMVGCEINGLNKLTTVNGRNIEGAGLDGSKAPLVSGSGEQDQRGRKGRGRVTSKQ